MSHLGLFPLPFSPLCLHDSHIHPGTRCSVPAHARWYCITCKFPIAGWCNLIYLPNLSHPFCLQQMDSSSSSISSVVTGPPQMHSPINFRLGKFLSRPRRLVSFGAASTSMDMGDGIIWVTVDISWVSLPVSVVVVMLTVPLQIESTPVCVSTAASTVVMSCLVAKPPIPTARLLTSSVSGT